MAEASCIRRRRANLIRFGWALLPRKRSAATRPNARFERIGSELRLILTPHLYDGGLGWNGGFLGAVLLTSDPLADSPEFTRNLT